MIMSRYKFKEKFKKFDRQEAKSWAKEFLSSSEWEEERKKVKKKLMGNFIGSAYTLLVGIDNLRSLGQVYDKRSNTTCYEYILNTLREDIKKKPS